MLSRLWFPVSLFALCVIVVAFAYVTRKPLCIDSKLVERFDRLSDSQTVSMYRCGLFRHVKFDPKLAADAKTISPRLQRLEVFFETLTPPFEKSIWTVLEKETKRFRIQGRQIFISDDLYSEPLVLEKAHLKMWYRERVTKNQLDFQLLEETITDLLLHAFQSQDSTFLSRWPRTLVTFKEYCQSPWIYLEHQHLCANAEQPETSGLQGQLAIPSLRALLSQSLISVYQSLSLEQQLDFLRNLGTSLAILKSKSNASDSLIRSSNLEQDMLQAAELIKKWSALIVQLSPDIYISAHLKGALQVELERRGFTEALDVATFDWVFRVTEYNEKMKEEVYKLALKNPDLNMAAIEGDKVWLLPNQQALPVSVLGQIKAFKTVQLRCGWPSGDEVETQGKHSQYLIIIDDCAVNLEIKLDSLIRKGVKYFAIQNPKLRFVSFHLPSFKMALKKGINPMNYLRDPQWQMTARFDIEASALQPLAAISAIDWFRP
jgi:hypothetical protein